MVKNGATYVATRATYTRLGGKWRVRTGVETVVGSEGGRWGKMGGAWVENDGEM